mgnify:CR=1 FL=1
MYECNSTRSSNLLRSVAETESGTIIGKIMKTFSEIKREVEREMEKEERIVNFCCGVIIVFSILLILL